MSTAGKSTYEAWKESLEQAEAEGDEIWSEEWSEASGPILKRLGAMDSNGMNALLVSVGLLVAAAIILLPRIRHLAVGERTVGVVVGHRSYGYGSSSDIRAPIVRYSAPGGVIDVMGFLPAAPSTYPLGKEVSVLYLRNQPGNAVIADFVQLFLIPTAVGGLGLVCLTGTAGFMYWTVRGELRVSTSVGTNRQFAVIDRPQVVNDAANDNAAKDDARNDDAANDVDANNDDAEPPNRQREHHAVAQG